MARKKIYEDYLRNFENMSAKRQVNVLMDAIEYMHQYNARSVNDCIVFAVAPDYDTAWNAINDYDARGGE